MRRKHTFTGAFTVYPYYLPFITILKNSLLNVWNLCKTCIIFVEQKQITNTMKNLETTMKSINDLVEDKLFRESVLEICKENGCSAEEWKNFKWAIILRFATHVICNKID